MNKVYSLHDAVEKFVESGDCISLDRKSVV